jgi:hypothetical protein
LRGPEPDIRRSADRRRLLRSERPPGGSSARRACSLSSIRRRSRAPSLLLASAGSSGTIAALAPPPIKLRLVIIVTWSPVFPCRERLDKTERRGATRHREQPSYRSRRTRTRRSLGSRIQ